MVGEHSSNDKFVVTTGLRKTSFILMGLGLLALIIAIIVAVAGGEHTAHEWQQKIWVGILTNNMFVLSLALAGLFFVAAHYLAYGGWYVLVKRIPEAMSQFIPVAGLLMLVVILGTVFHWNHIYHWADSEAVAEDPLLQHKSGYLNIPFFVIRFVIYFAVWTLFAYLLRKASLNEDKYGGLQYYNKSKVYSALFIVFFAVTSSTMAWDFLMSIDAHWFSTLFGWYVFSSLFVSGIGGILLITIFLKSRGHLPLVTSDHLHDLGKFLFAFSIFWTYLWFCQFMLIWYANIGEETAYFHARLNHYPVLFYGLFVINFVVPFLALMTRKSKRQMASLTLIAIVVLFGHYLDFWLMVAPGATGSEISFGLFEIILLVGYIGLFILVVFNALAKAPLTAVNHPFYKESIQHHT